MASSDSAPHFFPFGPLGEQALAYMIDAGQRWLLYLDLLRQRGDDYWARQQDPAPTVLHFEAVVLLDGRSLLTPVNYRLLRVLPPEGCATDPSKRPFVVFDPRAGQGPGIGGMKRDSEIGLALTNGHPVYFVDFLPDPVPGQTIEDACAAEAQFVAKIVEWHPDAEKPCLIGNCQAGWQIALMASIRPTLPGVLILAGAPLSYWAGVQGQSPMRYTAGLTGGSWSNAFLSDLGGGLFDGAWLVQAFEINNPAHAYWTKPYDVYAKIDTEGPRFLAFERWWGSPALLDAREIQFIADELFVGNHLAQGKIHTPGGLRMDLRNIRAPIVIFCSHGDDITPPPQALGWILDLYACDDDIVANEQTIVYAMHEQIGHLGLFVSSTVMSKELYKFISTIDMIETLPPGLYEAKFLPKAEGAPNPALASGDYVLRFERRGLDDIRALGCNTVDEERCFEAVARLSENLQGLYSTFAAPFVQAAVTSETAETLRQLHPVRLGFALLSSQNPWLAALAGFAADQREKRAPVPEDNLFWQAQEAFSLWMTETLGAFNEAKNKIVENLFFQFYGAPLVQASLGLRTIRPYAKPIPSRDLQLEQEREKRLLHLQSQIEEGGLAEATIRGLLYVGRGERGVDERSFRLLVRLREETGLLPPLPLISYKEMARRQYMMLVLDEARALRALPNLLDRAERGQAETAFAVIQSVFEAGGPLSPEEERRLEILRTAFVPAGAVPHRRKTDA